MRTVSNLCRPAVLLLIVGCVIAAVACGAEPGSDRNGVREIKNSVGMKLVFIPPGKFSMGSPESEPGREAQELQHEVELTKGFYLGAHEVTVGQFRQFVAETKFQTDGEQLKGVRTLLLSFFTITSNPCHFQHQRVLTPLIL